MYSKDYLKAKAEEVWNAYECFKDDLNALEAKATAAGIEGAEELDFIDTFLDLNEELGTVLEKLFGITCFEE
jgi:hypothetical protein